LYQILYAEENPHQDRNVRIHIIRIHIVRFLYCTFQLNYIYVIHTLSFVILRIYNREGPYSKLYFKLFFILGPFLS